MIAVVDRDYRYLLANRAFLRHRGKARDEVVGRYVGEVIGADLFEGIVKPKLDECFAGNVVRFEVEHDYPALGRRNLLVSYFPIEGPGSVDRAACVLQDITIRKQAEEALKQSEERYRELFENSRDAIYVHDLSGRYVSVNAAAEELSGYERDEILGRHYSNFLAPAYLRDARENFCRKLDVPVETVYEAKIVRKDGITKPVEVSSRMIYRNGEPVGVQGTVRDISERKRAQHAMQIYSRRLMQAQEAERENIARELHDEIGQVLTVIGMNLEGIRRDGVTTPAAVARVEESIEIVSDALQRVRELSLELRPLLLDDLGLAARYAGTRSGTPRARACLRR